ncbi:MAG: MFS transporter [Candidatus Latescibacteria bacterium]|nr:MFS transporter [Candidatus Latescibacterota bacterium]
MFNVIILGIASLLTDISSEMVYPIIPFFLVSLGAGPAVLGLIEGVAESFASLLKVFSGYFSDKKRKRKPLAIVGYASSTVGKLFLYLANSWGLVFLGRLTDRFGKGVRTAPRDALIADSTPQNKRGRAYGLHRAMDTLGATIGVLLAYFLIKSNITNYSRIFLFSLIPAFLGVLILFVVREKITQVWKSRHSLKLSWKQLPVKLRLFLIIVFVFALGNSSNQFLILRAKSIGFSITTVLMLYLFYNLTYGLLSYPIGRLSDMIGRKKILIAGYLIYGLVYLGFAVAGKPSVLWLLFGVYGFYSAFTEGVEKAFVSDIAPENLRGTLIGLHATLIGIGLLPASLIAGGLWSIIGASAPFYFGGVLGIIAAIGLAIIM